MFLTAGLLMATGFLANGHPAVAGGRCPTELKLSVTAQDVDKDRKNLEAFTKAVRDKALEPETHPLHFSCYMTQLGGDLRSQSTYIVSLAADGSALRIQSHGEKMGLTARSLNQSTSEAILNGLGIEAGDRTDLRVGLAKAGTSGTVGRFTVDGTTAYATVYLDPTGAPVVMVAGFDLQDRHLISFAKENIDHGSPTVTAREVVDRATLKAFVQQAGQWLKEIGERPGGTNNISLTLPLRDPNGPWLDKERSVYLYIWNLAQNTIMLHAGFPNRYERQPLVGLERDADGVLVLDKLKQAANSGPEGGFVDHLFDDPGDSSDARIPKTSYVYPVTLDIRLPDGTIRPFPFVVGSGFYRRPTSQATVGESEVIEAVAPQIMRSVTANSVDAVSGRISSGLLSTPSAAFSIGGASTLTGALQASVKDLADGTIDLDRLLANSSFTMPFNVADSNDGGVGESSPFGSFTFWGSGDYRSMSGGNAESVDYDGSVTSASLGIDTKLGADVLAGVALLWSQGEVDYKASGASGEITTSLLGVHPYLGWQIWEGMDLWSMAGYGTGKMEIDDGSGDVQENDLSQRMFAAGVKGTLASSDQLIAGGTTSLNVKGEVAFTWADVEGAGSVADMELEVGRQRLVVEGAHTRKLDSGATFTPSLEVGVRNDSGDGETGTGAEVGGALRYESAGSRLTVEGRVRHLLSHSGASEETGVSALVRIAPGAGGRGLALAVEPSWGQTASGVQQLWESGISAGASGGNQARLNAEVGYGFDAPRGLGVVTPYTGLALTGEGGQSWRMGARWRVSGDRSVSLEATRHEVAKDDGPEHGLMLRGALRW